MYPLLAFISSCLNNVASDEPTALRNDFAPSKVLGSAFRQPDFVYVLGEAQVAGAQHTNAFADETCTADQPVLRPIVRHLASKRNHSVKMIVSSTGFSPELFERLLSSGVGKGQPEWGTVHVIGDFSDWDTQSAYIYSCAQSLVPYL